MLKPLSLTAYGKHRRSKGLPGGTLKSVQRAVRAGRVTTDADGKIPDPEAADREWVDKTDSSRIPIGLRIGFNGGEEGDDEDDDSPSLSESAAYEKHFKASIAELNYLERAGELVNAEEQKAAYTERCSIVRSKSLGLPSKLKQLHPEIPNAAFVTLDRLIREMLTELADGATS